MKLTKADITYIVTYVSLLLVFNLIGSLGRDFLSSTMGYDLIYFKHSYPLPLQKCIGSPADTPNEQACDMLTDNLILDVVLFIISFYIYRARIKKKPEKKFRTALFISLASIYGMKTLSTLFITIEVFKL